MFRCMALPLAACGRDGVTVGGKSSSEETTSHITQPLTSTEEGHAVIVNVNMSALAPSTHKCAHMYVHKHTRWHGKEAVVHAG